MSEFTPFRKMVSFSYNEDTGIQKSFRILVDFEDVSRIEEYEDGLVKSIMYYLLINRWASDCRRQL